jgi:transposase
MSLKLESIGPIPPETAHVAKAAFPKGNLFMKMRDELGGQNPDDMFAGLFPNNGQPALAPWRLALVTIMQFVEELPDRQAADAVRSRIDWKYTLGLELEESGFDFSVLSQFRSRLIAGHAEALLFETLLAHLKERRLLRPGGRQRTDATHVLAAVRVVNRVVCVAETLRATLNTLAEVAPTWLRSFTPDDWYERYGHRIEEYRLPKGKEKRVALVEQVGADGYTLLDAIFTAPEVNWLCHVPAVEMLRRVWVQPFELVQGQPHFRSDDNIAPPARLICSPPSSILSRLRRGRESIQCRAFSLTRRLVQPFLRCSDRKVFDRGKALRRHPLDQEIANVALPERKHSLGFQAGDIVHTMLPASSRSTYAWRLRLVASSYRRVGASN